jgi:3-oxoacyl-[acyl-carrier protein] reductase
MLAKELAEADKSPLVLVNNAGITKDTLMLRMKLNDWSEVIDTNLTSIFAMVSSFIRPMTKARSGRIINISSVVGSMGNAGQVNYAASKAGVEGMTRAMAREFGSRAITVNAVAPGFIETDMTHMLPETQKEALLSQVPLGRLGSAEEVAGAVAFLASKEASYVTGTTLHVNGGMYMA